MRALSNIAVAVVLLTLVLTGCAKKPAKSTTLPPTPASLEARAPSAAPSEPEPRPAPAASPLEGDLDAVGASMKTATLAGALVKGIATREHIAYKAGGQSRTRFVEVCDSGDCVWIKSWSVKVGQEVRKKRATIYTANDVMAKKTELRGMTAN